MISNDSDKTTKILAPCDITINKWRCREGGVVHKSKIILEYTENDDDKKELKSIKAPRKGILRKKYCKEKEVVEKGGMLLALGDCDHSTVVKDMCASCGEDLRFIENEHILKASIPMLHAEPDVKVSAKHAKEIGYADTCSLLEQRKLALLVDLDQTIIHTTNDNVPNNIKDIHHFQLYGANSAWYHTRLRPYTHEFLQRISKYYELHICTFGARNYAHKIANIIDPMGRYFGNRILSRDECLNSIFKTENIKALFPNGDSMVCIIDDREDVWNSASNLIHVKPYHFFNNTGDINAPPGFKHELDGKEGLTAKEISKLAKKNREKANVTIDNTAEPKEIETTEEKEPLHINHENENMPLLGDGNSQDKATSESDSIVVKEDVEPMTNSAEVASEGAEQTETQAGIENAKATEQENDLVAKPEVTNTAVATANAETDQVHIEKAPITNATTITEAEAIEELLREQVVETETSAKDLDEKMQQNDEKLQHNDEELPTSSSNEEQQRKEKENVVGVKAAEDSKFELEIEDLDDYLLHLEVILKKIHKRFYKIYNDTKEIPDLKIIVPKFRASVLSACNIVFTGAIPNTHKLENTRHYMIARGLGAEVSHNITPEVTHLIAARPNTYKVIAAKKNAKIKIVHINWLWTCAERWEHVDERLFPLGKNCKAERSAPAHCHSPEHVVNYSNKSEISSSSSAQKPMDFKNTLNPLLTFTASDLAEMKDEVCDEDTSSSSDSEDVDIENPPLAKKLRKRKREEAQEELTRKLFERTEESNFMDDEDDVEKYFQNADSNNSNSNNSESDDELPSAKFRRGENLNSDFDGDDLDSDNNTNDQELDLMGAELERRYFADE